MFHKEEFKIKLEEEHTTVHYALKALNNTLVFIAPKKAESGDIS